MITWLGASLPDAILDHRRADGPLCGSKNHGDHDALLLNPWPQSLLAFEPMWWQAAIDTGHFTWEDAAAEYAAPVTSWWCGDYPASGPKE